MGNSGRGPITRIMNGELIFAILDWIYQQGAKVNILILPDIGL